MLSGDLTLCLLLLSVLNTVYGMYPHILHTSHIALAVSILSIFISTCSQVCIIVVCLGLWLMCIMICYVVREPEEGRGIV